MNKGSRGSIGRTTKVTGRLSGDGDLLVEGRVEGELSLKGSLHVAPDGAVVAPVDADDVMVEGSVEGDVTARGAVTLRAGGQLRGAIKADRVALEDGARYSGRIEMDVELPEELSQARR
jgi:cytoskeletal protein CcmA (bactofilin family)